MPKNRSRNVHGGHSDSRLKNLEFNNQALKAKLIDLEKTLERFTNRSKVLDMVLGRRNSNHERSSLGFQFSSSMVDVNSYARVLY